MRAPEETGGTDAGAMTPGLLITGSYAGQRTSIEALRLEDGLPVWWFDSRLRLSDLAYRDGVVVVSSVGRPRPGTLGPAALVGLRAADGARLWEMGSVRLRRQMGLRCVAWGLRALWKTASPTQAWQAMQSLELAGLTSLAVADDMVVCKEQAIFGLSLRSGVLRWVMPTLSGMSRPLLTAHGNLVYIQADSGTLEALDLRTGSKRWSSAGKFHGSFDDDVLAVSETLVYISNTLGRPRAIIALRVADGRREQVLPLADGETPARVPPDGIAYLLCAARLRALRVAEGTELWQSAPLRDFPDTERETFARTVRVATSEQTVFYGYEVLAPPIHYSVVGALDASSGARLWDWRGPERPIPATGALSLKAARDKVYIVTGAGIFALNGRDGRLLWQVPGDVTITRSVMSTGVSHPHDV